MMQTQTERESARETGMPNDQRSNRGFYTFNTRENMLKVVTYVAESGRHARIEPVVSSNARLGYYYPEIAKILGCDPGDELSLLESITEVGFLSRDLFDKVDLCPYCLHDNLRLRELCPYCKSSLISRIQVLHHFRCGWAGTEEEATKGTDLICPKCSCKLGHIDIDYERTAQSYYCSTCRRTFAQALEEFLSITCGRQVPRDGIIVHPVFAYRITPIGMKAAKNRSLDGVELRKGIIERDLAVYTRDYIERRLAELVNRYLRYKAGFAAALISVDQFDALVNSKGYVSGRNLVESVASLLRSETREVDLPGVFDESTFILLFPQTDHRGALCFADRLTARVKDINVPYLEGPPKVSISIASCPEDGEDIHTLISRLRRRIDESSSSCTTIPLNQVHVHAKTT